MLLHCGLELRHNTIYAALLTEDSRLLVQKILPNNTKILLEFLEPYRAQLGNVVMEETANWRELTGLLAEQGFRILVI